MSSHGTLSSALSLSYHCSGFACLLFHHRPRSCKRMKVWQICFGCFGRAKNKRVDLSCNCGPRCAELVVKFEPDLDFVRCDGLANWLFWLKTGSRSSFRSHSDHRAGSVFRTVAWYSTCSGFAIFSERSRHCWALSREDQWSHTSPMIRVCWSWQLRDHGHDHSLIMTMIIFWKTTKFSLQPSRSWSSATTFKMNMTSFHRWIFDPENVQLQNQHLFLEFENSSLKKYLSQTCEVRCYYSNKNYLYFFFRIFQLGCLFTQHYCEGKCGRRNTPTKIKS